MLTFVLSRGNVQSRIRAPFSNQKEHICLQIFNIVTILCCNELSSYVLCIQTMAYINIWWHKLYIDTIVTSLWYSDIIMYILMSKWGYFHGKSRVANRLSHDCKDIYGDHAIFDFFLSKYNNLLMIVLKPYKYYNHQFHSHFKTGNPITSCCVLFCTFVLWCLWAWFPWSTILWWWRWNIGSQTVHAHPSSQVTSEWTSPCSGVLNLGLQNTKHFNVFIVSDIPILLKENAQNTLTYLNGLQPTNWLPDLRFWPRQSLFKGLVELRVDSLSTKPWQWDHEM